MIRTSLALLLLSAVAAADVPLGTYVRVTGWAYEEVDVRSCGKDARDALRSSVQRVRTLDVSRTEVKVVGAERGVKILSRMETSILAADLYDDTAPDGTKLRKMAGFFVSTSGGVMYFRDVKGEDGFHCSDTFAADFERRQPTGER